MVGLVAIPEDSWKYFDDATADVARARRSKRDPLNARSTAPIPTLTILEHPHTLRIGERALLSDLLLSKAVNLARGELVFSQPGDKNGTPLADPFLSRKAIRFVPQQNNSICMDPSETKTSVLVDGMRLSQAVHFSPEEMEEGVVLELSGRIVLLFHLNRDALKPPPPDFGLVGGGDALNRVKWEILRVADLDVPILLRGESGTGKELVANALHSLSKRGKQSFVSVNMGAIPPTLANAELFGAKKGSFTGSVGNQTGYFRAAHKGTLFLDEVGEAIPEIQAMLLRVLETGEIYAVGAQTPHMVDVRLIAATDADLESRVASGSFRGPLFHRLASYEIWLPPLRKRRDDIGRLFIHFLRQELDRFNEGFRLDLNEAHGEPWLPPGLMTRLATYDWPGNVRQLRNVARQLAIGNRGQQHAEMGPKLKQMLGRKTTTQSSVGRADQSKTADKPKPRRKPSEITEEELIGAMRENRWEPKATAQHLRVSRTSLYALIEQCEGVCTAADLSPGQIKECYADCSGDLEAMVTRLEVSKHGLKKRIRSLGIS